MCFFSIEKFSNIYFHNKETINKKKIIEYLNRNTVTELIDKTQNFGTREELTNYYLNNIINFTSKEKNIKKFNK